MEQQCRSRVVVTIHGIRTHGKWQKSITPHLARHGLIPYHIDYGRFGTLRFLFRWSRNKKIEAIRDELRNLVHQAGVRRVSVIAHSFGTLLAIEALQRENGNLMFDRVVLTGSILRLDFDWNDVLTTKKLVMAVRNERATSDRVVALAAYASKKCLSWLTGLDCGPSGLSPFTRRNAALIDASISGDHSATHNVTQFERWARFIAYPYLTGDVLKKVQTELQAFRQLAAKILGFPVKNLRVNLFAPIDGALRIVPGAVDNMTFAPEFDLEIEPNHGATGSAFMSGSPCIVIKRGGTWTGNDLPGDQLEKINPSLSWVVSLPVKSTARGTIVGVVNVDGLDNTPLILDDEHSVECQAAVVALFGAMLPRFEPCLDAAFRGEELPKIGV